MKRKLIFITLCLTLMLSLCFFTACKIVVVSPSDEHIHAYSYSFNFSALPTEYSDGEMTVVCECGDQKNDNRSSSYGR